MSTQKYLRKIGTDYVYAWAPGIKARPDMIECDVNGVFLADPKSGEKPSLMDPSEKKAPYLRKIGTMEIFAWSPFLAKRADMVPHNGKPPGAENIPAPESPAAEPELPPDEPVQEATAEQSLTESALDIPTILPPGETDTEEPPPSEADLAAGEPESNEADRKSRIMEAVKLIDPASYAKPVGGRPAMPYKADVEKLSGLSGVKASEVMAAMDSLKE